MSERVSEEPIELTDAELKVVSGGMQSFNGFIHEEAHESPVGDAHERERGAFVP